MPAKPKFKSEAFEAIHSNISGMFRVGTVDEATMRHFDKMCLIAPTAFGSAEIMQSERKRTQRNGPL